MARQLSFITMFLVLLVLSGCQSSHQVEVKPVEIKPIHITIDVNVKVDRALDNFFNDIDAAEDKIKKD
ncbi:MAG: YnbE family lipoprotein [Proteobacteria bacterium]|nr:YnbE family lipoprotein [Desulfobacula sp.]MBU3954019.1 YnbE family lipoprotein [Pseudomonadota bacterium]MBU4133557.1 YnbE family lipoprotein [Pseudomonadota bacterium]